MGDNKSHNMFDLSDAETEELQDRVEKHIKSNKLKHKAILSAKKNKPKIKSKRGILPS